MRMWEYGGDVMGYCENIKWLSGYNEDTNRSEDIFRMQRSVRLLLEYNEIVKVLWGYCED